MLNVSADSLNQKRHLHHCKDVEPNLGDGKDGAYRKLVDGLKTEGE